MCVCVRIVKKSFQSLSSSFSKQEGTRYGFLFYVSNASLNGV